MKELKLGTSVLEHEATMLKSRKEQLAYSIFQLEARLEKEKQGLSVIDGALQEAEKLLGIAKGKPKPPENIAVKPVEVAK